MRYKKGRKLNWQNRKNILKKWKKLSKKKKNKLKYLC